MGWDDCTGAGTLSGESTSLWKLVDLNKTTERALVKAKQSCSQVMEGWHLPALCHQLSSALDLLFLTDFPSVKGKLESSSMTGVGRFLIPQMKYWSFFEALYAPSREKETPPKDASEQQPKVRDTIPNSHGSSVSEAHIWLTLGRKKTQLILLIKSKKPFCSGNIINRLWAWYCCNVLQPQPCASYSQFSWICFKNK